jgi:hypothetical protein
MLIQKVASPVAITMATAKSTTPIKAALIKKKVSKNFQRQ